MKWLGELCGLKWLVMKKIFILVVIVVFSLVNSSAQLKTYTGPYKIASTYGQGNATATYTYIEDPNTLQRMKNGNFSLKMM